MNLNWQAAPHGKGVINEEGQLVASCPTRFAPLIAAAPGMLQVLRQIQNEGLSPQVLASIHEVISRTTRGCNAKY